MFVQHGKNLPCHEEEEVKEEKKNHYRLSTSYVSETVLRAF